MSAATSQRWLLGWLALVVAAPAIAWLYGTRRGEVTFVLYREPKLVAAAVLGWTFLAAWAWAKRRDVGTADLIEMLQRPPMLALAAFLSYLALTRLWVRVPENHFYEANQYALLFPLLVTLLVWQKRDARVARTVRRALVASLALVTAVGVVQRFVPIPVLSPIDLGIGVHHPSFMGYKNPMALSLLGQLFLLAGMVFKPGADRRRRIALGLLLAAELVYIASLQSRTSIFGLLAGALWLVALHLARRPSRRQLLGVLGGLTAVALVFGVALGSSERTRQKARSVASYLARPAAYLVSDRGTYLRNTVRMARHHPLGVGLGDWQTHYPVYRPYQRETRFSDEIQVRRAHSDHVQFLGEAGWPGLTLWGAFLALLLAAPTRRALRRGDRQALFTSAQLAALIAAMGTDYLIELPYNKLQLFLVAFLALADHGRNTPRCTLRRRPVMLALAVLLSATAVVQVVYHVSLAKKAALAAAFTRTYLEAVEPAPSPTGPFSAAQLAALATVARDEPAFLRLAGHTKTLHRDYLVLAHTAYLLGRRDAALALTDKALDLHPYFPNALRWMAVIAGDEAASQRWLEAYEQVMHTATDGFQGPYPGDGPRQE